MKLTWFGGTTLRIHIGGRILVAGRHGLTGVDPDELVSGADLVFELDHRFPEVDPAHWQPRRPASLVDDSGGPADVVLHRIGPDAILVDATGEPPLLLLSSATPAATRWGRDAVIVVFARASVVDALDRLAPRLIALALPEPALEEAFAAVRDRLNGTALVALEPGMALEV